MSLDTCISFSSLTQIIIYANEENNKQGSKNIT